jgi:hypothetical protein
MKKAIAVLFIAYMLVMGMAVLANAGLADIVNSGEKASDFVTLVESIKTFNNVNCPTVDAIEAATGVDLKGVTDNKIQIYFGGVTISAAQIVVIKQAAIASDTMCEFIDTLVLPATDN